jgi:hypothetical protein
MDSVKAIVHKVIPKGNHGPFAVSTCDEIDGSVTFSLEPTVWKEDEYPEEGSMVYLGNLRQKRAGWRAKEGRFWQLSDEQTQQSARSNIMQFLYPCSRQFPFDEVTESIVRQLEKRNWQVPGITVDFDDYGSGEEKYRMVRYVRGLDFKLWFCRKQRTMPGGRYNDTAAVTDIVIPQQELHVYEDQSGPTYYRYVGDDWEKDRERFMNGSKVNSKLNGEPRTYLQYKGACDCGSTAGAAFEGISLLTNMITGDKKALSRMTHTHSGRRSPLLVHDNDLNREYEPEDDEPIRFKTEGVFEEFRRYLEDVVLRMIMSEPEADIDTNYFPSPVTLAMSEAVGPIFTFGEYREVERIKAGKADKEQLDRSERYGLNGGGYRLMSLGTSNDGTVPEIAYDGFKWCTFGEVDAETAIDSLEVPGHYRWSDRERFIIRVIPNRANDIYVADHAAYEKRREEIWEAVKAEEGERDRLTDAEADDFVRARARTIVPLSEYDGSFEQPVVLVNRELSFDEVEVVSGPHKDWQGR